MGFASKILLKIAANALVLWAATNYISGFALAPKYFYNLDGFTIDPAWQSFVVGGAALAAVNLILGPILKVVGAVLPLITFAMLSVLINIGIIYFADSYSAELAVSGLKPLIFSGGLVGIINALL
ncbi:MAG: phage holin family protein [Candidatus Sungbacteria bacterium]|nr:phage holin family protein [Candidatus Sungbacteria bacterium]